jgi:parvulin-like peptidyl-prolyl isomerase
MVATGVRRRAALQHLAATAAAKVAATAAALACALPLGAMAQQQAYGLAARVNGAPITVERLERNFEEYLRERQINITTLRSPARAKQMKREVLDLLVDQELLWQEAQRRQLQATPAEVQTALASLRAGFKTPQGFESRLRAEGFDEASYAAHLGRLLAGGKVLQQTTDAVVVDDAAIHAFYLENDAAFLRPEQRRLRHLYRPFEPGADKAAAREAMAALLRQARAPAADFAELARVHSRGSSAARGGDIGFVVRSDLAAPLAEAAFALPAGGVTDIIELAEGLHLLKLEERVPAQRLSEDSQREGIRTHLARGLGEAQRQALMQRLRAAALVQVLLPLPPAAGAAVDERGPAARARALSP